MLYMELDQSHIHFLLVSSFMDIEWDNWIFDNLR